jgi:hypothetical protein
MAQISAIHINKTACLTPERAQEYILARNEADEGMQKNFHIPDQTIKRYVQGSTVIEISFGPIQTWQLEELYKDDANSINDALLGRKRRSAANTQGYDAPLLDHE